MSKRRGQMKAPTKVRRAKNLMLARTKDPTVQIENREFTRGNTRNPVYRKLHTGKGALPSAVSTSRENRKIFIRSIRKKR